MAFTVGTIAQDIIAYWGRPSEQALSQDDVITVLNRRINRLLLLSQLANKSYLAVLSPPFTFDGPSQTRTLSFDDLSSVVRVESRSSGDEGENNWCEETIVDYSRWNDGRHRSIDAVSFYGSAPSSLTMATNRDVSGLEFRILYETGGVTLSTFGQSVPILQDFFKSAVFYSAAAESGTMIYGLNGEEENSRDKKVSYLEGKAAEAVADFKKWLLNNPNDAISYRESFGSSRNSPGSVRMFASDDGGGYFSPF